ncbi:hypothetical protein ACHAXT_010883 [Thalassiosira profunda]
MGKKSRKVKSGGGDDDKLAEPSPEFFAQLVSLREQTEERRRLGSSCNEARRHNPRVNAEAERIATEARAFKKARMNGIAHKMYTQAITLDPFNHTYFHHRSEAAFNARQWELGLWDVQLALDLCHPPEDFALDPCFAIMWTTLTRCHLELGQLEQAKQACEMGQYLIPEEVQLTQRGVNILANYHAMIVDAMGSMPSNRVNVVIKPVKDPEDELMFLYSTKSASLEGKPRDVAPLQPELLAVDLDESVPMDKILAYVNSEKLPEWSEGPDALEKAGGAFPVPETGYWVTSIPVFSKKDRTELLNRLMCDCLKTSKIVVLRVEETEEPPVVDTAAYLAAVVKNAKNCEKLYGKGRRLVDSE